MFGLCIPGMVESQISYPVDLRVGVHTASTKRNTSLGNVVSDETTASMKGLEATISSPGGGAGIGGRVLQGTFDDDVSVKEGFVQVGIPDFSLTGTFGQRSVWGTDSAVNYVRVGARSIIRIGGSGVSLLFSGSKYLPPKFDITSDKESTDPEPDGWEGETGIFYTAPRAPIYVQLGYRTEYFSLGQRDESLHGVIFGVGLWLGGR